MSLRNTLILAALGASLSVLPTAALAAPAKSQGSAGGSGSAKLGGSSGASGQSSAKRDGDKSGFKLPDFVYGGNAISTQMPLQVGLTNYMPRARLGFQYERQIFKAHWIHLGVAALLDRGDWETFRMASCGFENTQGTCQAGTVAGLDIWLGYTHKWHLKDRPYIVPYARLGAGGGFWKYPSLGGERAQTRVSTWNMSLRAGGGIRVFLSRAFAVGLDLNMQLGFAAHRDEPLGAAEPDKSAEFLLGLEILPLVAEFRF